MARKLIAGNDKATKLKSDLSHLLQSYVNSYRPTSKDLEFRFLKDLSHLVQSYVNSNGPTSKAFKISSFKSSEEKQKNTAV